MFKLRKTRQKLALSLTPLGAVRAAAEGTGYKNTMCCIKTETKFEQNYLPFRKSSERENHPA